ncbi:hypothetical protein D3C75_651020 [compost metagenome]
MVVNQPTVRDKSTSAPISSRPCPSRCTRTAPLPPLHSDMLSASAVNSTSPICVRYAPGTSVSSLRVCSRLNRTLTRPLLPSVLPTAFLPSPGSSATSRCPCSSQYPSSACTSRLDAYFFSSPAHSRYEVVFAGSCTASPSLS